LLTPPEDSEREIDACYVSSIKNILFSLSQSGAFDRLDRDMAAISQGADPLSSFPKDKHDLDIPTRLDNRVFHYLSFDASQGLILSSERVTGTLGADFVRTCLHIRKSLRNFQTTKAKALEPKKGDGHDSFFGRHPFFRFFR